MTFTRDEANLFARIENGWSSSFSAEEQPVVDAISHLRRYRRETVLSSAVPVTSDSRRFPSSELPTPEEWTVMRRYLQWCKENEQRRRLEQERQEARESLKGSAGSA